MTIKKLDTDYKAMAKLVNIAEQHGVPVSKLRTQLEIGYQIEMRNASGSKDATLKALKKIKENPSHYYNADFDESKHKRDESGKFTKGGGGGGSSKGKGSPQTSFTPPKINPREDFKRIAREHDYNTGLHSVEMAGEEAQQILKTAYDLLEQNVGNTKEQNAIYSTAMYQISDELDERMASSHKSMDAKKAIRRYVADHLRETIDGMEKAMTEQYGNSKEKRNATVHPKTFYCRHMQPGTARYEGGEDGDEETILVELDAMRKMGKTMEGVPVYIEHRDVDLEDIHNADGFISDCFYNELDGWLWAKFVAITDAAQEAIQNGWSVSNAYMPTQWGPGGSKNNVDYDREVLDAQFTHLAIVPNPRYERAEIFTKEQFDEYMDKLRNENKNSSYRNSNDKKGMNKMIDNLKFWKKVEVKNADDADHDLTEVTVNGKPVKLNEMIEALEKKNTETEFEKKYLVNGEEKSLDEIVSAYKEHTENADDDDEDDKEDIEIAIDNEDDEDEQAENSSDEDEDEAQNADDEDERENEEDEEKAKENAKKDLASTKKKVRQNASSTQVRTVETRDTQMQRGMSRYGR